MKAQCACDLWDGKEVGDGVGSIVEGPRFRERTRYLFTPSVGIGCRLMHIEELWREPAIGREGSPGNTIQYPISRKQFIEKNGFIESKSWGGILELGWT